VSAAAHRSILVGGGGAQPIPKRLLAAAKKIFSKVPENFCFYPQHFWMTLFLVIDRKLQQNKYTSKMASATRRQLIGGGGVPINKIRRRRQQIIGGSGAAQGSILESKTPASLINGINFRHGRLCLRLALHPAT